MIHCTRTSDIYHPFALLHSLNYFHFCFHCHFLVLLSSTSCITASFIFASGHPGLQIKILYYWTLSSTVQYAKAQPLVEDACTWQCTPDMWTDLHDWTCEHGICIFETWMSVCRGLTVLPFISCFKTIWSCKICKCLPGFASRGLTFLRTEILSLCSRMKKRPRSKLAVTIHPSYDLHP